MQTVKKKILIVEDQKIIAIDLKKSLIKTGYKVVGICDNSEEALAVTRECKPDLILMDIIINGEKNGIETAEMIKEEKNIPIIFLTALTDVGTYLAALKTEPYKYLMKPVETESLQKAIGELFKSSDSTRISS